ncbi:MAG: hypothetical protein K9G60_14990, partial [Pseudolabrys sp.]|nr:hypothetical protein [Pseudolabrys sp.]
TPPQDYNGSSELTVTAVATDTLTGLDATTTAQLPLTVTDVPELATLTVADPASSAPPPVTLVSVNDWYNPDWGGGFNATFELTITDEMIANDSVDGWTLGLTIDNPAANITGGWLDGFNAPVSFDAQSGTFSTVDQVSQLDLVPGDTIQFTVQVQDAGFNFEEFSFAFTDADAGTAPTTPDAISLGDAVVPVVATVDLEDTASVTTTVEETDALGDATPLALETEAGSNAETTLDTEIASGNANANSGNSGRGHAYGKTKNGKDDSADDEASTANILQPIIDLTDAEFLLALETLESPSIDPGTDMSLLDPTATAEPDPTVEPSDATPTAEPVVIEPEPETPIVEVNNPLF